MVEGTLPQERCDFYVYVIFRTDGTPCYVGKGRGRRWRTSSHTPTNQRLRRIRELAAQPLPAVKVREHLTEAQAFETEIALIATIGRGDHGPLVNFTDGGEGTSGLIPSAETLAKLIAARAGRELTAATRAKIGAANSGLKRTPEFCAMMSAARLGKRSGPRDPSVGAKISAAKTGKKRGPPSPEWRAKISAATTGVRRGPCAAATRQKIAATMMGRKLSAEHAGAIGRGHLGKKYTRRNVKAETALESQHEQIRAVVESVTP